MLAPTSLLASAIAPGSQRKLSFGLIDLSGDYSKEQRIVEIQGLIHQAGHGAIGPSEASAEAVKNTMEQSDVIVFIAHGNTEPRIEKNEDTVTKHIFLIKEYTISRSEFYNKLNEYDNDGYQHKTTDSRIYNPDMSIIIHYEFDSNNDSYTIKEYISEDYFKNVELKNNAIVFFGACSTLAENDNVANIFLNKGAIAYLGYDNTTESCGWASKYFVEGLLNGMTIDQAFSNIPEEYRNEKDGDTITHLLKHLRKSDSTAGDYRLICPQAKTIGHKIDLEKGIVTLEGIVEGIKNNQLLNCKAGFTYWNEKDFANSAKLVECCSISQSDIVLLDSERDYITFQASIEIDDLSLDTQYCYNVYLQINNCDIPVSDEYIKTFEINEPLDSFKEYLIRLYRDTNGDNWIRNDNWCSDRPITEWYGVYKTWYGYLLDLGDNNLQGRIDLSNCRVGFNLQLDNNHFDSNLLDNNIITSLECPNSGLVKFDLPNSVKSINISNCPNIEEVIHSPTLEGEDYVITEFDASYCENLRYVTIKSNSLRKLNLAGCTALYDLRCYDNKLTELTLIRCISLDRIDCSFNCLSHLIVDCPNVTCLLCGNNNLEDLIIVKCKKLEILECHNNHITSVITPELHRIAFTCDLKYDYFGETPKENQYGWYYPGEPDTGDHIPPKNW